MKRLMLAALMVSSSAHAEYVTGNALLRDLNEPPNYSSGYALGYIAGAYDTAKDVLHCVPYGVTLGQLSDVVHLYLRNNPSIRHLSGDSIVNHAIGERWPCPKKTNL